jgi:hypothetical protein
VTHTRHSTGQTGSVPPTQRDRYLPTLYKARRVPAKQPVCAICVERTRGRTVPLHLGYGVVVHLCDGHASPEFQAQRGGRDLVLTLERLWRAHGCLTVARANALRAHLAACRGSGDRRLPGSYAWPRLRQEAETAFARGRPPMQVIAALRAANAAGEAVPPSIRTMRRWHTERRWIARPP